MVMLYIVTHLQIQICIKGRRIFKKHLTQQSKEFEFSMNKLDEDYLLVVENTATVATYYDECLSTANRCIRSSSEVVAR